MNVAVGMYAVIATNEADVDTLTVVGKGALDEGPIAGTSGIEEEGVVGMIVPGMGWVQMVWLNIPDSAHTEFLTMVYRDKGTDFAKATGRQYELVHFGPNGREHVEWMR